jgi:hypothetical protein
VCDTAQGVGGRLAAGRRVSMGILKRRRVVLFAALAGVVGLVVINKVHFLHFEAMCLLSQATHPRTHMQAWPPHTQGAQISELRARR